MADDILKFRAGELRASVMDQAADRDMSVSEWLREATEEKLAKGCDHCGGECDVCGSEVLQLAAQDAGETATITATGGKFSQTSNPDVQALIDRAKELLAEGAVGVSVALDLDPADMPDGMQDVDPFDPDPAIVEAVENAHLRIRHVAIVDTPAFSGAYLTLGADGSLTGPLVFEGIPTGDLRFVGDVGKINLESTPFPVPIIFDLAEGDHTGTVLGFIDAAERVSGVSEPVAPVAASGSAYPAYLFAEPQPGPMTVSAPDARGFRRYSGTIMPAGVCHKGMGGCYTYKHKAFSLDYFHSGASIPLDDGTFTRVGPLMFGDLHADGNEMDYATALTRTNEDARTVFTMGRVFHHPSGLLYSGVLMPDADIPRVQATAPSVEIWPDERGRPELKTALNVPRPALPVAASLKGGGIQLTESDPVVVEEPHGDHHTRLDELAARLDAVEASTAELLAAHYAATL